MTVAARKRDEHVRDLEVAHVKQIYGEEGVPPTHELTVSEISSGLKAGPDDSKSWHVYKCLNTC